MNELGPVGLWTYQLRFQDAAALPEVLAEVESLGYGAVWFPGGPVDNAFDQARLLLDSSSRLTVATGILSVWVGDAAAVADGYTALRRDHPGRFVLGLGISHPEMVDRENPGRYRSPIQTVADFLTELDAHGVTKEDRALAALGPKMLKLAAARTVCAHPYFVPVEHTAFARDTMGPNVLLAPEQAA